MTMSSYVAYLLVLQLVSVLGINVNNCTYDADCVCSLVNGTLYADCSNRELHRFPTFWPNVSRINISNNSLIQFPDRSLIPDDLTYLDFSFNKINKFRNNTFKQLWKLSDLRLNHNRLQFNDDIERDIFADLINIKHLDISNNPLLTFRILPILIYGLQNSTIEILRLNKLHCPFGLNTELRIEDVRYLRHTNLRELHIASNKIVIIETGAVYFFPSTLQKISLADNALSFGLYIFEMYSLKNLETLIISQQHRQISPHEIYNNLIFLACNNGRRYIPDPRSLHESSIEPFRYPKGLQNRRFRKLSSTLVNVTVPIPKSLKTVYMNDGIVGYAIPEMSFSENSIENVYLQGNLMQSWNGPVRGMENLKRLNLSNNFCSKISTDFFQHFTAMSCLYLNNNLLGFSLAPDTDGNIFKALKRLKYLELKNNKITHLPFAVFKNLKSLEKLYLNDNLLTDIRFDIVTLKSLQYIDLSENQIQYLSESTMHQLDQHADLAHFTLNLKGNPLLCSCGTLSFLQWMIETQSRKIDMNNFREYTCTQFSRKGKILNFTYIEDHIEELTKKCSSYTTLICVIISSIILFLVVLSAGLFYRFRWKLRYFYYMTKSRYHGYKAVRGDDQSDFKYDAFVSYADEDMEFVREMISKLEGERNMRLCIHHRDFVPGYDIAENIITAINKSKKTIVILSENFIKSSWCMYELHIAKMEEIYSRDTEDVLFLLCYKSIPTETIPLSVMDVINQKSYIQFPNDADDNTVFWNRLWETV
nr:toll-like receptor 6 isoform X3 [Crassostrea virginica]